ncbi:hypothetical protein T35B1_18673 [Salinisphaera shabanensis T35B1]|uniref:hypothetical protein n=1 Tax=Salinisphaera shabanensis TaxID=180542 RepID=UPI003342403B
MPHHKKQITAADYYEGVFPKAKGVCQLWNWHELLYAGLLEADPDTAFFRPRGRRLTYQYRGRQQIYQPDFVVTSTAGVTRLITIKLAEEITRKAWPWLSCITAHCRASHEQFEPTAREAIDANACLAFNWIQISRYIVALDQATIDLEVAITRAHRALTQGAHTYDSLRDALPRSDDTTHAAIPFVLLHRGLARCPALATDPLHGGMTLWPA